MKRNNIPKRVVGTLALPIIMFLVMMVLCYSQGKIYYGTWRMWQTLLVDIGLSVATAMGIGLQFKCGRFDFSGGSIMLISSIIAGNVAQDLGNSLPVMFLLCLVLCVALSLLVAVFYIFGRVPIVITTIGLAMLYEAITCLIYNGQGINLVANMSLRTFSTYPAVLLPALAAIGTYAFFSYCTVAGKEAVLLANNQQSAVNIGINEKKNVLITYLFSGLIFGFATIIYMAMGQHRAAFTSMSTVNELFSNILPVFIGLIVGVFCGDTIGMVVGAVTLGLMSYGLTALFSNEMGTAVSLICTGVFVLLINVCSAQGARVAHLFFSLFKKGRKQS